MATKLVCDNKTCETPNADIEQDHYSVEHVTEYVTFGDDAKPKQFCSINCLLQHIEYGRQL